MRICQVIQFFVVFEGFGKLRRPFCIFGNPFLGFETREELLKGFERGLKRFGNPFLEFLDMEGVFVWIWKP